MSFLPQEILDRIVRHSLQDELDIPIQDLFPEPCMIDPLLRKHEYTISGTTYLNPAIVNLLRIYPFFLNPFMHVNQACRQEVIHQISRESWLILKISESLWEKMTTAMVFPFPQLDSIWGECLAIEKLSSLTFDLHHSEVDSQPQAEKLTFMIPYSSTALFQLFVEIGERAESTDNLHVKNDDLSHANLNEVKRTISFLRIDLNQDEVIDLMLSGLTLRGVASSGRSYYGSRILNCNVSTLHRRQMIRKRTLYPNRRGESRFIRKKFYNWIRGLSL